MRIEKKISNRIIDIGCSPGNSTSVLRKRWQEAEVIGLDSSEVMLEQTKRNNLDVSWICRDGAQDLSEL